MKPSPQSKHKYLDCCMEQEIRITKCFNLSNILGIKMRNTLVDSSRFLVGGGELY